MNVAAGLRLDLSSLPSRDRRALVKLIARISEASYRRGFQQGVHVARAGEADEESALRLRSWTSLDRSPRGEKPVRDVGISAGRRLNIEFGISLQDVGLEVEP